MYVKLHWDATAFSAGLTSVEHKIRLGGARRFELVRIGMTRLGLHAGKRGGAGSRFDVEISATIRMRDLCRGGSMMSESLDRRKVALGQVRVETRQTSVALIVARVGGRLEPHFRSRAVRRR